MNQQDDKAAEKTVSLEDLEVRDEQADGTRAGTEGSKVSLQDFHFVIQNGPS